MKEALSKCLNELDEDLKTILYFPFLDKLDGVANYLQGSSYGLKERLRVQSQFSQKKFIRQQKKFVIDTLKAISSENSLDNSFKRSRFLKSAKRIRSKFWQRIIELPISLEAKNKAWSSRLKRGLSQESPYYHDIKGWGFSEEEIKVVRDYFLYVLGIYVEKLGEDEELKIIAEKLSLYGMSNEFKVIRSRFDADWSLSELRESFKNPYLRNKYFDFWFQVLMNRTSSTELNQRIRESIVPNVLARAKDSQFWVFEYFFPADKDMRKMIISRFNTQWRTRDRVHRFHILRALSNSAIKTELSKRNRTFKRAIFQIERQFFSELLSSGEATHYAFYKLTKMGDKSISNLWWLMY